MLSRTSSSGRAALVVFVASVPTFAACDASTGGGGEKSSPEAEPASGISGEAALDGGGAGFSAGSGDAEPESAAEPDAGSPEPAPEPEPTAEPGWGSDVMEPESDAASWAGEDGGAWWGPEPDAAAAEPEPSPEPGVGPGNDGCEPVCTGLQCGPDGCGGTCGWCSGFDSCQSGACVEVPGCKPACAGKMPGLDDACGGVCTGGGLGIGLAPGGAQDAGYFEKLVKAGQVPPPEVLPIEGWLNQHDTPLPPPEDDRFISLHAFAGLFYDPEEGAPVVAMQLGMNSATPPSVIESGRFNLCVAVDRSGSMQGDDRIEFVKDGLVKLVDALHDDDYLSIVTYSDVATVLVPPVELTDPAGVKAKVEGITAIGSTNLYAGLELCYAQVAKHAADKDAIPRVILVSDGLPTEGVVQPMSIVAMSSSYNDVGIGLTTIGVGEDFGFELMYDLAVQGLGNFYFLDSAEKLVEVFQDEITYLLTPVAENLRIWFSLPDGFGVEEIYGFEFEEKDGEWHLLGPEAQVEIGGDGTIVDEPPPPNDPGDDEEAPVGIKTVFASKENGLLMVKVTHPGIAAVKALEGESMANLHYSYDLVSEEATEAFDIDVLVGGFTYDDEGGFAWFSDAIMQRNFCILRAGLAMKEACTLMAADADANRQAAIVQVQQAITFCEGINLQLAAPDQDLVDDVALMETLKVNLCAGVCLDPASAP